MHVELRPIGTVRPYQNNPRLNDAAVDAVAASIKEFGFRQPLVVDEDGVIVVGHTRSRRRSSWAWRWCRSTSPSD
jgi:ParB-like chromosome segregation protein Spo0J